MKTQIMNLFRMMEKSGGMGKSLKSLKSLMQIFATYATYASANFVGKESNETTVRYALWSRISLIKPLQNPYLTLTRFRLSLGSNLSRFSLASLICLCMLTVGSGNVWADYTVTFSTSSFAFASGGEYVSSSEKSTNGWEATTDGFKYGASRNTGYTEFTMKSSGTDIGQIKASKITFKDVLVYSSDGSSLGYIITYVGGGTKSGTVLAPASAADKDVELDDTKTIQKIKIYSTANKKRFYCKGFTVVAAAAASCGLPTSPSNGAKTAATQPVSWTAPSPAPASGYLVAIGATSTPPGDDVKVNSSQQYGDYYVNVVSAGTTNLTFTSSNGAWVAGEEYHWWVRSKCGASDYSAWVAGTAFTIPNIEVSETAIDGLDYDVSAGGPSTAKTFTVSGTGLTGNLTIALDEGASSKFEISKTSASSGYGNSLTLTQSSGTVSSTTIWVRLKSGHSAGDYLEQITVSGGTATSKTVAIEGVVCTLLSTPTSPVVDLNYEEGGYTYVKMSWSTASDITDHATYLNFAFGPSGSSTPTYSTSSAPASAHSYKYKKSLLSDGTYWWKVRALGDGSSYCDGAFLESTFTICTKDVSGETPIVNAATSIGKYGATANWSAVTDADHYTVKVYRGSNASGTLEKTYSDVTGTSQVITGLSSANTTYYIEVQAHDACGHDSSKGGVTFTTLNLTLYTVTFVNAAGEAPAAVTQLSEGGTVSIPDAEACDGWEFAGWKIGSAQSSVTSDPTGSGYIKNATYPFNYTPGSNITAYAVFKKTEGGGGDTEVLAKSIGFESSEGFTASTAYNNESTPNTQGPTGEKWDFIMGTPSSNDALKNSQSAQMRSYSGKYTAGYVMMTYNISRVTKVKFLAKNNGTGALHCYYSTNSGSTWTGDQNMNINNTATYYTYTVSATGEYANVRIKFQNETTDAAGRVYIDSVYIYHMEAGSGTTTWKSDVSCTCPNYSFHSKNSSSVWDDPICFAQVGSSTLYRTEEIELPTDGVSFKVGWHDADDVANAKTNEKDWQYMVAGPTTTRLGGGYWTVGGHLTSGNTGGAKGYFYVYSDSDQDNKYVGFTPSGYVLRWGNGEAWTSKALTAASASIDETEWNTEVVTLSSSNASDHIYVGLKTESGYVWCNNSEEQRVIFLSPGVWDSDGCKFGLWDKTHLVWRGFMQDADGDGVYEGTVPSTCTEVTFARFDGAKTEPVWDQQYDKSADQTISSLTDKNMFSVTGWGSSHVCAGDWNTVYSKPGVFRINAGSNLKNWSCKFVPHFVLTYNKNNNDATGTTDPTTVASDAGSKNVSVSACGFTGPTGYHFDHWDTAPDGSGTDYDPNDTYSLTADVTLYAIWAPNTHTLTWEYDGGTPSGTYTAAGTVAYGTALTAPAMTKTGYSFNVWSPSVPATMPDNDATYTATWTANTYSVRFNANGGSGSMSNQNFTYGVAQNLTSNGFTAPEDKSFGGWTTNSDGTGDFYTNGQEVSNLTSVNGATVDLYAKWVDCDLYTVTLNVNGDTYMTLTQGSCGSAVDLSGITPPACGGGYTFRGWSTTNSATPMLDAPTITTSYTPESNTTLYAVYSYSAEIGTLVTNISDLNDDSFEGYLIAALNSDYVMGGGTHLGNNRPGVACTKVGNKCIVTGDNPGVYYFTKKGSIWYICSYTDSYQLQYFRAKNTSGQIAAWDEEDLADGDGEGGYEVSNAWDIDQVDALLSQYWGFEWTISAINSTTGSATIYAENGSAEYKYLKYNSGSKIFSAYSTGQNAIALYLYESGTAYTTQPNMTVYTITKGVESNGTFTIAEGVACSGQAVAVSATPASGYAFSGWESSNGGSFGNASSASTTFTPTANTTVTATFVARVQHDITWMVNGAAYTTGTPTNQLYGGDSYSTMTLPAAPANNTLSSACGAVANQFVGWSTTDMGFATGQSAPAKLFTNAAGAGSAYGTMGDDDVTFYAVFAQDGSSNYMSRCANTYSITLDKKDGTTDGTAVATEMGSSLDITLAPVYAGHSVEGYYAETGLTTKISGANGTLLAGKSGYTDGSGKWINTTSPLTLYTNWTLNSHTLTWNLDGGSISAAGTPAGTIAYGTELVAPTVTKTGYTFNAWSPAVDATMPDNDVTYTATWTAKQYAITYKDKDDAAYSGDKTDGRPTGCPANHTYGSATDLLYGVKAGYRFDGWFTTSACTGDPITSLASDAEGPFTLYAKWTASHTFTFSKNGVVDGTLTLGQVEGGNVIMPNTTVDCGLWTTFEGWVIGDVVETTTEPTTIYKPGDIFVAGNSNQEFKAVYSKHEGDGTVSYVKVASNSVTPSGEYVIASPDGNTILTGLNGNKRGTYEAVSISDNTISNKGNGVVLNVNKKGSKFNIKMSGDTKYITSCNDAYFEYSVTDAANACMWELTSDGYIHSTDHTTRYIEYLKSGTQYFGAYTGTQWKAYLYRKRVAGTTYYTTAPGSCEMPTKITVSYNDNKANAGDQTIEGMPSGATLDFTSYPDFASYTIGAAPTDPTGYHFAGWNTSVDGGGDAYTAGSSVTTFGYAETITLYAQWERVYTVTLYDNGVERTRLTQASAGANVTLPSGNNCGVGSAFTFVGWTDSPVQLNAEPVRPNIVSGAGEWGDDELTDDITLYSVYSKSVAGCDDFSAGVSGAYTVQRDSYYAQNTGSDNQFDIATTNANAAVFYIAYSQAKSGYTIRTKDGYIGWNYDGSNITRTATSPYYWNINGSAVNGWKFTPQGISSKYLSLSTSGKFKMYGTDYGYNTLTKTAMTYYYNTAICEENSITFHDGGGSISGTPTTPDGASWNSGTFVLSGLEDCDKITTFPTASYDGWTFIGWSTEDYSNSGKHIADYAEENASTDEPDASIIYKTGGNPYVVRGGSIDLYPVFTRFPDNEPFDMENGGEYYMYYLDESSDDGYGAPQRRYAGEYDGTKRYKSTTRCAEATTFVFTKDGDVWHIQNKANNKYIGGAADNDWLIENASLGTLTDWTITIRNGNQFNASCQSNRQIIVFENFFMDYASVNLANNLGYHCVYLGSCEERIYSSEPSPVPTIDLTGEPMVTSAAGQRIRATEAMTLSGSHLAGATKITLSGTNLTFATSATATPAANLEVTVTSGSVAETNIYVYYTPGVGDTSDGIESIIVTATDNGTVPAEAKANVSVRHLPADFVIAAKWGDKWYALPNTCNDSKSSTTGVVITVDNDNDPTCATAAPSTAKWGLRQTKQPARITAGYADRLTFTERGTTATADNQQALYNYNSADVYTNAQWTNYANTNPDRYEWIPVTADFKDYTLTNASESKPLILRNDGEFKAQTTNQAYNGKVRLLPATFYEEAPVQIVEWKANSVVVMYTGTETSATTKVGSNSASAAQTLSTHKLTHGIYELATGQSLASNDGKNLLLTFGSMKKVFEIPVIITGNLTAYSGHEKQDVVIVNGGKLSASATKYSYHNIYVYGGGKLKIASGSQLGVNNIILRAGGITTSGIGSSPSATYEYVYPQVELGGTLTSTKTDIKYEYITDYDHWYQLCLPFNATLSSIHYPQEYYGDNVTATNTGSWVIKRYAGEVRATGNYNAWVDIESESATSVTAGHGYIYWGAPKKVTIGGDKQRQAWGIQRITMPVTAVAATTAETADKNISVDSYSEVATSDKPNDQGWNLIGNPYMVNLTDLSSTSMIAGQLVPTETVPWDGKWRNNGDGVRYVTIPDNHFDSYVAKTASLASGEGDFMPGRAFFVQIAEGASTLTFAATNRASLMPARFAQTAKSVDIETGIVMSDESKHDEVNFWIKEDKTAEYEYNADYPKTPNNTNFNIYGVHSHGDLSWIAISPEIAEGSMAVGYQVPTAGEYRLSLSETYVSDKIDQLLVTDHEMSPEITTNLLTEDYVFQVNQAETNNTRFTVSIRLAPQTPTDIGNVPSEGMNAANAKPQKFIYHDKLYILRNGVIYDATGKQVKGGLK